MWYAYALLILKYGVNLLSAPRIKRIASKFACNFDCDWQCASAFFHSVTVTHVLLSQIISYSDTKGSVLVVMECKRACKCDLCIRVFTSYFKVNRVYTLIHLVTHMNIFEHQLGKVGQLKFPDQLMIFT